MSDVKKPPPPMDPGLATLLSRRRLERAGELRCMGHSRTAIARMLNEEGLGPISPHHLQRYLDRLDVEAQRKLGLSLRRMQARQIERLDYVYRESALAWERSKRDSKLVRSRTRKRAAPPRKEDVAGGGSSRLEVEQEETQMEVKENAGDPRFLEVMRSALADQRKVLGLDAPDKHQIEEIGSENRPVRFDLTGLSMDQLKVLQALLGDVLDGKDGPAALALPGLLEQMAQPPRPPAPAPDRIIEDSGDAAV